VRDNQHSGLNVVLLQCVGKRLTHDEKYNQCTIKEDKLKVGDLSLFLMHMHTK
jgi:hypothetical protein